MVVVLLLLGVGGPYFQIFVGECVGAGPTERGEGEKDNS